MLTLQDKVKKIIEYLFYALFFLTPFAMTNVNHELFEFNKMWLVYFFSVLIFFFWTFRMVSKKQFFVRRTPLDIPILLFLLSQIISTIISIDSHTSFWGYYSRFNGGLLSTICYIFLYYALTTNFFARKEEAKDFAKKILGVSIISGALVTLWGIPGHFGYDPTCLIFGRGLTTSCWTEAFNPTVRIFSTLGQPNWLAAYLSILLIIAIAFIIKYSLTVKTFAEKIKNPQIIALAFITIAFYMAILWTNSQSGFLGFWGGLFIFIGLIKLTAIKKFGLKPVRLLKTKTLKLLIVIVIIFIAITFFIGNPFPRLQGFSFGGLTANLSKSAPVTEEGEATGKSLPEQTGPALEYNITGSGNIRLIVWKGALNIFKSSPLFGTGVETFAYAYYKQRPIEHNLTSEWDYLYNKAHNEYLNYLATTGIFGLGSYLAFIGMFLVLAFKFINSQKNISSVLLPSSLIGALVSILISNFFGFSVVIPNLYLFTIPTLFFLIIGRREKMISLPQSESRESYQLKDFTPVQILIISAIGLFTLYSIWFLINSWRADKAYALGYNYNKINEYVRANEPLEKAVKLRPGEDLFKNELSVNLSSIALAFATEQRTDEAAYYAGRAKELSDEVERRNPNNLVYYKTRTRVLYTLAQLEPSLLDEAYKMILKALELAPTDAKIHYNKALIEEILERKDEALKTLDKTIDLKNNYDEAYIRKAIILMDLADEEKDRERANEHRKEAKDALEFVLKNISPNNPNVLELLKTLE